VRVLAFLPLVLLVGCAGAPALSPPVPAQGQFSTFSYACDGGRRFEVIFDKQTDLMTIIADGTHKTLPHAMSASGARYADGEFEYWSKGTEAMLNGFPGGPYENCKEIG
jgi:membrane-bound inhibitor of C-type lysozyme